mgnify:CR=1 FL=1
MYTRLNGDSHSDRDLEIDNDGHAMGLRLAGQLDIEIARIVEPLPATCGLRPVS